MATNVLYEHLAEIERERERGRDREGGREGEIWNERGGERCEIRERRNII